MSHKYILDGHTPVLCTDLIKWATWFETANRQVELTHIGDVDVSTIFLGLDFSFGRSEKPQLFETRISGGEHANHQERYSAWDEAVEGHKLACQLVEGL
jgi:hypothetical protein